MDSGIFDEIISGLKKYSMKIIALFFFVEVLAVLTAFGIFSIFMNFDSGITLFICGSFLGFFVACLVFAFLNARKKSQSQKDNSTEQPAISKTQETNEIPETQEIIQQETSQSQKNTNVDNIVEDSSLEQTLSLAKLMLANGKHEEAISWYEKAADFGSRIAIKSLQFLYEGKGVYINSSNDSAYRTGRYFIPNELENSQKAYMWNCIYELCKNPKSYLYDIETQEYLTKSQKQEAIKKAQEKFESIKKYL